MAKKKKGDAEEGDGSSGGAKGLIIKGVVLALVGAFIAKTFIFKPPAPTPEETKASVKEATLHHWEACAISNDIEGYDVESAEVEAEFEVWFEKHHHDVAVELHESPGEGDAGGGETEEGLGGGGLRRMTLVASAGAGAAMAGNPVLEVEAVTVNLSDGYLKAGLGVVLVEGTDPELAKTHGLAKPAQALLVERLTGRPMAELQGIEVRTSLEREMGFELCKEYAAVSSVKFTDFVMQPAD